MLFSVLLSCFFFSQPSATCAASCIISTPSRSFEKCVSLPTQQSSLAWTFHPSNTTLDLCFFGTFISPSGWVGFGINPSSAEMTGTRALISFTDPNTGQLILLPYILSPEIKLQTPSLQSHSLDIPLLSSSAALYGGKLPTVPGGVDVQIYASLKLEPNKTKIHAVWNRGSYVQGYSPKIHPTTVDDLSSVTTIDILSGFTSRNRDNNVLKIAHGTINSISWGLLLPIGALIARYLRHIQSLEPVWFYAHVVVQLVALLLGAAGFGIGIWLGNQSPGITYNLHKTLGISVLCLGALQTMALLFRPKTTSKCRNYWESYHHLGGYACVILGVVNVFQGFNVMNASRSYPKLGYCLCLAAMIGACVAMEANSWIIFCRKAKEEKMKTNSRQYTGFGELGSHQPLDLR